MSPSSSSLLVVPMRLSTKMSNIDDEGRFVEVFECEGMQVQRTRKVRFLRAWRLVVPMRFLRKFFNAWRMVAKFQVMSARFEDNSEMLGIINHMSRTMHVNQDEVPIWYTSKP